MVPNSAGENAYPVDDMTLLRRFPILGSEGGSYYSDERKLTLDNVKAVKRCITASEESGIDAVGEIVAIGTSGPCPQAWPRPMGTMIPVEPPWTIFGLSPGLAASSRCLWTSSAP